ncbi:hypothetical protein C8Q70DRAFT_1049228 [Cubamyces menziesii]|nr:hypothetical protein C8Q70DRAFT_1049228 [Cubamyces menziesii]
MEEAYSYYAGLLSIPTLLYRTGPEWSPPPGPHSHHRRKQLIPAFGGQLERPWNEGSLGGDVVKVLEENEVYFTSVTVVRFQLMSIYQRREPPSGWVGGLIPFTIYIGVVPDSTTPSAAHDAAIGIQTLLQKCDITDTVNIEFAEFRVRRESGPQLLTCSSAFDPLLDVIGPFSPALGLYIHPGTRPDIDGTMAIYLTESGEGGRLLGLTCRHVVLDPTRPNTDYEYRDGISKEKAMDALKSLRIQIERDWGDPMNREPGHVLRSPPVTSGVDDNGYQFTEDWAILELDRAKLRPGFDGNQLDLELNLSISRMEGPPDVGMKLLRIRSDDGWSFGLPHRGLLPLHGVVTDKLMRAPDLKDCDGNPCLPVYGNGSATGLTLGHANGFFAINRMYKDDSTVAEGTSREWVIHNYGEDEGPFSRPCAATSGPFSRPGDSGSLVVDVRGRIGGVTHARGGKLETPDITYATPWWWLLEHVKKNGFSDITVPSPSPFPVNTAAQ